MIVSMEALPLKPFACAAAVMAALMFGSAPALADESESANGGGGHNVVQVVNRVDGRLNVRGRVDFNIITGPTVRPVNAAYAYSSCNGCQTLAVALQINLISMTATDIRPVNLSKAINYSCHDCLTVADAVQYTIAVADPEKVEPRVEELFDTMQAELAAARPESARFSAPTISSSVVSERPFGSASRPEARSVPKMRSTSVWSASESLAMRARAAA